MEKEKLNCLNELNRAIIRFRNLYSCWATKNGISYHEMLVCYAIREFGFCTQKIIGKWKTSLLVAVIRFLIVFPAFCFIMDAALGADGLMWVQPITDTVALILILNQAKNSYIRHFRIGRVVDRTAMFVDDAAFRSLPAKYK